MFSVVGEIEVVFCCHVVALMLVQNVHIEDAIITTHILLIRHKIYHELINKKFTD